MFTITSSATRIGVITYSNVAEHSIKLKDHTDMDSFHDAVHDISLMNRWTRIDLALRLAQKEMFITANGGRSNVPDILILLTDGAQTKMVGAEDPAIIAEELRNSGVTIIAIGMGTAVDMKELTLIAGGTNLLFTASTFTELNSDGFQNAVKLHACLGKSIVFLTQRQNVRAAQYHYMPLDLDSDEFRSTNIKSRYCNLDRFIPK